MSVNRKDKEIGIRMRSSRKGLHRLHQSSVTKAPVLTGDENNACVKRDNEITKSKERRANTPRRLTKTSSCVKKAKNVDARLKLMRKRKRKKARLSAQAQKQAQEQAQALVRQVEKGTMNAETYNYTDYQPCW
jgi:hypothetical protein